MLANHPFSVHIVLVDEGKISNQAFHLFQECSPVFTGDETIQLQFFQVMANGNFRYLEYSGQVGDLGRPVFPE